MDLGYYNYATHLQHDIYALSIDTHDLNFGWIAPTLIASGSVAVLKPLYLRYWFDYLNERYSEEVKVVTQNIRLTPAERAMFRFYDKVQIKNQEYRVIEIEYNIGDNELAKVKMLKL